MRRPVLFSFGMFLLGIGAAVLVFANPFGSAWIDRALARAGGPPGSSAAATNASSSAQSHRPWRCMPSAQFKSHA